MITEKSIIKFVEAYFFTIQYSETSTVGVPQLVVHNLLTCDYMAAGQKSSNDQLRLGRPSVAVATNVHMAEPGIHCHGCYC